MSKLMELAYKFDELLKQKDALSASDKNLAMELASVEKQLLDAMDGLDDDGHQVQNLKLTSGRTLYKRRDRYYGVTEGHSKGELISALANCDLTVDLVTAKCDMNSLRSRIKEIEAQNLTLPDEVTSLLHVTEKYKVGYK